MESSEDRCLAGNLVRLLLSLTSCIIYQWHYCSVDSPPQSLVIGSLRLFTF